MFISIPFTETEINNKSKLNGEQRVCCCVCPRNTAIDAPRDFSSFGTGQHIKKWHTDCMMESGPSIILHVIDIASNARKTERLGSFGISNEQTNASQACNIVSSVLISFMSPVALSRPSQKISRTVAPKHPQIMLKTKIRSKFMEKHIRLAEAFCGFNRLFIDRISISVNCVNRKSTF